MSSAPLSQNPFICDSLSREGESPQERARREQEEARAKAVSDAIDEQIMDDKVALRRYQKAIKILLLGQCESGKSAIIKNFQLEYAYNAWVQERGLWKIIIYLNLVRSVTTILEIMKRAMEEQRDRIRHHRRSLSPTLSFDGREPTDGATRSPRFNFSEKHRLLLLRLAPLTQVQKVLKEYLDSALEPDQVGTTFHTVFPSPRAEPPGSRYNPKYRASYDGSWRFPSPGGPKDFAGRKSTEELRGIVEVLYCCASDIKQLWADYCVFGRALDTGGLPFEHLELYMSDIDHLLARDYEPSDQDIARVKARTGGVQEYRFSIPGVGYQRHVPSNRAPEPVYEDWVLYDLGGTRTFLHSWCSYFDNVNSIVVLAPVDCFDQRSEEDRSANRLEDSMLLWKHICSCNILANIQIILFLTKVDLLKEKLASGVRFSKHVPSYGDHPNDTPSVISYLKSKFKAILQSSGSKRIFYCYLASTDDMKVVTKMTAAVREGVLRDALGKTQTI